MVCIPRYKIHCFFFFGAVKQWSLVPVVSKPESKFLHNEFFPMTFLIKTYFILNRKQFSGKANSQVGHNCADLTEMRNKSALCQLLLDFKCHIDPFISFLTSLLGSSSKFTLNLRQHLQKYARLWLNYGTRLWNLICGERKSKCIDVLKGKSDSFILTSYF